MSASCQFVNSMFEVRPIGTRTKFKPVKVEHRADNRKYQRIRSVIFLQELFCKRNVISE